MNEKSITIDLQTLSEHYAKDPDLQRDALVIEHRRLMREEQRRQTAADGKLINMGTLKNAFYTP